jgi:hypothetical protein
MYAFFSKTMLKYLWNYGKPIYHVELTNGKAAFATGFSSEKDIKGLSDTQFLGEVKTYYTASENEVLI